MNNFKTNFIAKSVIKGILFLVFFQVFISCENEIEETKSPEKVQKIDDVKLVNGVLHINSKASIQNIIDNYKKGGESQNQFNDKIRNLQNNGFLPLTPIFPDNDAEMIEAFVKRKIERLQKRDEEYGIYSKNARNDKDIDLDDEVIFDPAFSALLNEKREIVVGEKFYKYNEMGVFFCDTLHKGYLEDYLEDLTKEERVAIINHDYGNFTNPDPCAENPLARTALSLTDKVNLYQPEPPTPCSGWGSDGGSNGGSNSDPAPEPSTYAPSSDLVKEKLPTCEVVANTLWEHIWGPSDGCFYYMNNDDRRVKTKFWNQNFFIFSSIGCKVKWQKHVEHWWASWWEKSYAQKLELGVNSLSYEYNFNLPVYNQSQYNNETTFFQYNGTKYNSYGQVINDVPTGVGNFIFNNDSSQEVFSITFINLDVTNANINQVIDVAAKSLVDHIPDWFLRNQLKQKMQDGQIRYDVVITDPLHNKVTLVNTDVRWGANDAHVIDHYFDFNFLVTWNSNFSSPEDYLHGLMGATTYTNVKADIYGAALSTGSWGGHRMIYNK